MLLSWWAKLANPLRPDIPLKLDAIIRKMMESYENGIQNAAPDVMSFNAVSELETCGGTLFVHTLCLNFYLHSVNRQSPQLVMNLRQHRDVSTKEYIFTAATNDLAQLARPYNRNGWNLVHVHLPSTPHLVNEINSALSNVQLNLDDMFMVPFNCKQDQLVRNGNFRRSTCH